MKGYLDQLEDALRALRLAGQRLSLVVTGSRDWPPDAPNPVGRTFDVIYDWYGTRVNLHHGGARGIDTRAHLIGLQLGWRVTPHPVRQAEWGRHGGWAGHQRNARMLDAAEPDLLLAFIWRNSRGSTGCRDNALGRGIPCVTIDEELAQLPRYRAML